MAQTMGGSMARLREFPTAEWGVALDWLEDQLPEGELAGVVRPYAGGLCYLRWAADLDELLAARMWFRLALVKGKGKPPARVFRRGHVEQLFQFMFPNERQGELVRKRHIAPFDDRWRLFPADWGRRVPQVGDEVYITWSASRTPREGQHYERGTVRSWGLSDAYVEAVQGYPARMPPCFILPDREAAVRFVQRWAMVPGGTLLQEEE